jgi:hypothetical protein
VHAGRVPGVITQPIACVAIATEVMHVVVVLEESVMLNDPGNFGPHVRPYDGGCHFRVIVGRDLIADVVQKRGEDQLVIGPIAQCTSGRLQ